MSINNRLGPVAIADGGSGSSATATAAGNSGKSMQELLEEGMKKRGYTYSEGSFVKSENAGKSMQELLEEGMKKRGFTAVNGAFERTPYVSYADYGKGLLDKVNETDKKARQLEELLKLAPAAITRQDQTLKNVDAQADSVFQSGTWKTNPLVSDMLNKLYERRSFTAQRLDTMRKAYTSLTADARKAAEENRAAVDAYNGFYGFNGQGDTSDGFRLGSGAAWDTWRNTIRPAETIAPELEAAQKKVRALTEQTSREREEIEAHAQEAAYMNGGVEPEAFTARRSALQEKERELETATRERDLLQEEMDYSDYLKWEELRGNRDFAARSGYTSKRTGEEPRYDILGNGRVIYTNRGSEDYLYDAINGDEQARNILLMEQNNGGEDQSYLLKMTPEQVSMYDYVYAAQGKEKAAEYLEDLKPELTAREREDSEKRWREYAAKDPVGSSVFSALTAPLKGVSYIGQTVDYLADGKIDENARYNRFSYAGSAIRDQVSKTVEEKWGKAGSFLYQTGMSMADFLLTTAVSGGQEALALGIMGTGAAADSVIEAKERGLSDGQAFTLGSIAGLAEIVTEKVSLEKLLDKTSLGKNALGYFLKNVVAEGSEEAASDVINWAADVMIAKDKSQWKQAIKAYTDQGMDEKNAFREALKDKGMEILLDAAGGALSGGVMAGGGIAGNTAMDYAAGRSLERGTGRAGAAQMAIDAGLERGQGSDSYDRAVKYRAELMSGKEASARKTGRLTRTTLMEAAQEQAKQEAEQEKAAKDREQAAKDKAARESAQAEVRKQTAQWQVSQEAVEAPRSAQKVQGKTPAGTAENAQEDANNAQEGAENAREGMENAQEKLTLAERRIMLERRETALREKTRQYVEAASRGEDTGDTADTLNREANAIEEERRAIQAESRTLEAEEREQDTRAQHEFLRARERELTVAPTAQELEERRAKAGSLRELERSGRESGATEEQIATARRIADATGRKIVFMNEKSADRGNYKSGTIYVNAAYGDETGQIIAHELTHSIEESELYGEFSRLVQNRIMSSGRDLDAMLREINEKYERAGVTLDAKKGEDMKEVVAEFVERELLTNEESITSLVRENRSLGRRILDLLDKLLAKLKWFKGAKERTFVQSARDLYAAALVDTRAQVDTDAALDEARQALAAGEITDEEFESIFDALGIEAVEEDSGAKHSVAAVERQERAGRLRSMLNSGASVQDLRRYVNGLTDTGTQQSPAGTRTNGARQIINAAHGANMSVDEYLRQNWDEYEVDGQLRPEARRALEMEGGRTQYSIAEDFTSKFDTWLNDTDPNGNLKTGGYFRVGTTSAALKSIGVNENTIYWDKGKIADIMKKHPEMTPDVIKQVPQILENPILVMQSKTRANRITLFGELTDADGTPILAAMELRPQNKRGEILNYSKVTSAYAKQAAQNLINSSDILYVEPNKNRTDSWLEALRLQLPAGLTKYGSIGRVTYSERDVNGNLTFGDNDGKTEMQRAFERAREKMKEGSSTAASDINAISAIQENPSKGRVTQPSGNVKPKFSIAEEGIREETDTQAETETQTGTESEAEDSKKPWQIRKDLTDYIAKNEGYPVVDGVQLHHGQWVLVQDEMLDDEGDPILDDDGNPQRYHNFGMVVGMTRDKRVAVHFWNKGDGKNDIHKVVPIDVSDLTPANAEYQPDLYEAMAKNEYLENGAPPEMPDDAVSEADIREFEVMREPKKDPNWKPIDIGKLPAKAKLRLDAVERRLVNKTGNLMQVPRQAKRDFLREISRKISEEYLTEGGISQETRNKLFETAYKKGIDVNREYYDQYKDLKKRLKETRVTIGLTDRADVRGYDKFNDFRKAAMGILTIVDEDGTPVDLVYQGLSSEYPELFPADITSPADMLSQMYEVGDGIRISRKMLTETVGSGSEDFRKWAGNDFNAAVSDAIAELHEIKRYAEDKIKTPEVKLTLEEVKALYPKARDARKNYEKVMAKQLLTEEDQRQVGRLMRGELELSDLKPKRDNVRGIKAVFDAKQEYEKYARQIREWNNARKESLRQEADEYLTTANGWKDKPKGILYSRETMERNVRDIVPDQKLADRIVEKYFKPVHEAAAKATKLKNQMRDRVRALNISRKVDQGNEVSEAHAVQLMGEALDNIDYLTHAKTVKKRDGKSLADWRGVLQELYEKNPNMDWEKVKGAVESFRKIYDELFELMNDSRVRNGYEPVAYRRGYFPHFQPGEGDGIISLFGKALGISTEVTALPTTINGLTHTFRPGIRYFGNALQRTGFNTTYDAVEGFDKYIEGVADVIYQTENIQRLRALADQIRYRTATEGLKSQIDEVLQKEGITERDRQNRLKEIYDQGKYTLSNFIVELEEYTNLLANKKSRADRNMEQALGRNTYNLVKALESRVAANMVAVNPGSWLTNFIPLTQGWAMLDRFTLMRGMWDTLKAYKTDDGIVDMSTFLTNRRGSDPLVKTWQQEASAKLSSPMEVIDNFTAGSLVRARYRQNINRGMSETAAMEEADSWVAGVMADRSKGSTPTLFNRSSPLTKMFTQFQLEVNNQLGYVFKDMPRGLKEKGVGALAMALFKFALGAWLYDELYEYFIGRRPALDPIGILNDTVGDLTGYELPNMVSLVGGAVTGNMPSFKTSKGGAVSGLINNVADQLPFMGAVGALGLDEALGLDIDAGRLPMSSAIPDVGKIGKALSKDTDWDIRKRVNTALKEIGKPLTYILLPFGGGQMKKILQGVDAAARGGSYTVDEKGRNIMQYPVYKDTLGEKISAYAGGVIFGKASNSNAVKWVENNFKSYSAKATGAYQALTYVGVRGRDADALIIALAGAEKTDTKSQKQVQIETLRKCGLPDNLKLIPYYAMVAGDKAIEVMDKLAESARPAELFNMLTDYETSNSTKGGGKTAAQIKAVCESKLSDKEKIAAMEILEGKNDYHAFKMKTASSYGISMKDYYAAVYGAEDTNGDGTIKQKEVAAAIRKMNLTKEQKAVLYQLVNTGWEPAKNPFSTKTGKEVYKAIQEEKDRREAEEEKEQQESEPEKKSGPRWENGRLVLPKFGESNVLPRW